MQKKLNYLLIYLTQETDPSLRMFLLQEGI